MYCKRGSKLDTAAEATMTAYEWEIDVVMSVTSNVTKNECKCVSVARNVDILN